MLLKKKNAQLYKYNYADWNGTGRKTTLDLIITLSVPKYLCRESPVFFLTTNLDERWKCSQQWRVNDNKRNERGRKRARGRAERAQRGRQQIKGYRNGRMGHYGGRNVFDEWPFYHIKPEQWSIMCYCSHCVINLPLSGNADTTDRPRWKAGSTWKEKVQRDKMAAESPFGLITLDICKCFMLWRQVALFSSEALVMRRTCCEVLIIHNRPTGSTVGGSLMYLWLELVLLILYIYNTLCANRLNSSHMAAT